MKIKDWIETMSRSGLVCSDYMRKMSAASTKEEVFKVLCDVNGGNWLFEQHAKGVPLPIEDFIKEYANYLDGKRVMEYPQGYTSKFYCRSTEPDIDADTTLVYLLECMDMEVSVPKNKYPSVILSDGSQCDLVLGEGARANVELYGDAHVNVIGDMGKVRVIKH